MQTKFEAIQTALIEEEIAKLINTISLGQMTPEIYKFECGKLAGMRQVLGYSDEVNKKLAER